jgi:hypothetical protein
LISFVNGGNTTLDYSWVACPDPGIDYGAAISCESATASLKLFGSGTFPMATISATANTGNATNLSIIIPSVVFTFLATQQSKTQYNGLDYLGIVEYRDQGSSAKTKAIKKIKLSTKSNGELNTNPTLGNIQLNGSNIMGYPNSESDMGVSSLSAADSYDFQSDIGIQSLTENMFVSWYSSTGEFIYNTTDIGESNPFTPSGSTGVFVIVYRDGRGGVTTGLEYF